MITNQQPRPQELATTFSALGDRRRLAILARLQQEKSLSISALCEGTGVSRQAISKHLKTLSDARLVSARKSGRETRYSLEISRLNEANTFLDRVGAKWDSALLQLKEKVE